MDRCHGFHSITSFSLAPQISSPSICWNQRCIMPMTEDSITYLPKWVRREFCHLLLASIGERELLLIHRTRGCKDSVPPAFPIQGVAVLLKSLLLCRKLYTPPHLTCRWACWRVYPRELHQHPCPAAFEQIPMSQHCSGEGSLVSRVMAVKGSCTFFPHQCGMGIPVGSFPGVFPTATDAFKRHSQSFLQTFFSQRGMRNNKIGSGGKEVRTNSPGMEQLVLMKPRAENWGECIRNEESAGASLF